MQVEDWWWLLWFIEQSLVPDMEAEICYLFTSCLLGFTVLARRFFTSSLHIHTASSAISFFLGSLHNLLWLLTRFAFSWNNFYELLTAIYPPTNFSVWIL